MQVRNLQIARYRATLNLKHPHTIMPDDEQKKHAKAKIIEVKEKMSLKDDSEEPPRIDARCDAAERNRQLDRDKQIKAGISSSALIRPFLRLFALS